MNIGKKKFIVKFPVQVLDASECNLDHEVITTELIIEAWSAEEATDKFSTVLGLLVAKRYGHDNVISDL